MAMHTLTMRNKRLVALACGLLFCALQPARAEDVPDSKLTEEEKQKALDLDKAKMFADKQKDLITSQAELAKAKVAAVTPAAGAGVTPPTGAVSGANDMTFAMYMVSLEGLERVAQALCNDLASKSISDVFITGKDVVEAAAKDEAAKRARAQLVEKLASTTKEVVRMTAKLNGKESATEAAPLGALAAVASGIDIAAGLVKGVAGLAGLFKSERTIAGVENLLGAGEVSAAFSMCQAGGGNSGAPRVNYVDSDVAAVQRAILDISKEVGEVREKANLLDDELAKLQAAAVPLDQAIAKATADKDKAKLKGLESRKAALNYEALKTKASTLLTLAQTYADTVHQVDATTGLSPLVVSAQLRALRAVSDAKGRLTLTLLKSGGYSLTTKRLLLNDRVDYAGGVAVRASVMNTSGVLTYDRVFYRDSGWIRADFDKSGEAIKRQNF